MTNKQTNKQTNTQTNKQTNTHPNKQTNTHPNKQTTIIPQKSECRLKNNITPIPTYPQQKQLSTKFLCFQMNFSSFFVKKKTFLAIPFRS